MSYRFQPSQPKIFEELERIAPFLPGPIYWKDKNSIYLGANQFYLNATGLKKLSDLLGKTDYELWPEFAEQLIEHEQEVMQTGKTIHKEEGVSLPDGSYKYFSAIKIPLRDEENNIIGIIGNSVDITAQIIAEKNLKIAEEKARLSKLYLEHIVNSLPEPVYWTDKNGVIQGCNTAESKLFNMSSPQEVIGNTLYDIAKKNSWEDGVADEVHQNLLEVMKKNISKKFEEVLTANNEKLFLLSHKAPLFDEDGKTIGMVGTSIDITARKEAERLKQEKLEEQEKFVKTVMQVVHDVRSPLMVIEMLASEVNQFPEAQA